MPKNNEIREDMNNSSVQSTSGHETAYSAINGNALNLLITLKEIERTFYQEYERLVSENELADYEPIYEKFYSSFGDMLEALKTLLAETTEINISKSF